MAYLIDGNNLLGFSFPGEHRDPENKRILIRKLLAFQRQTRSRVILVFDGRPVEDLVGMHSPKDKFEILYPEQGEKADSVIKEILAGRSDLRDMFVVSSDREIRTFAVSRGAKSLTCEAFQAKLGKVLKERKSAREMNKYVRGPTSLEVHLWEDVFKKSK